MASSSQRESRGSKLRSCAGQMRKEVNVQMSFFLLSSSVLHPKHVGWQRMTKKCPAVGTGPTALSLQILLSSLRSQSPTNQWFCERTAALTSDAFEMSYHFVRIKTELMLQFPTFASFFFPFLPDFYFPARAAAAQPLFAEKLSRST